MRRSKRISVSLGIFVFNEEKNILRLLESIEKQQLESVVIKEILVISSGSNDGTNKIVRNWQRKHRKVRLITEVKRRGKSAAINVFVKRAVSDVVVSISGDLRLHKDALEEIIQPFFNEEVGMVGAHPVPSNVRSSTIGKEIKLLWELHHRLSLKTPKCGEMVAFRNIVRQIPTDSAVDEATLEVLLQLVGYEVIYAPHSIVYNKGPVNLAEFVRQRRRVFIGHQWVSGKYNYRVASMNSGTLTDVMFEYLWQHPQDVSTMVRLVTFELYARFLAWVDYQVLGKNPYKWKMISR